MSQDRIRFVTANFYQLQGLRLMPIAVFLLWLGASAAGWLSWLPDHTARTRRERLAFVFGLAVATGPVATAGYRRRYGKVTQWSRTRRHHLIVGAVVMFVALAHVDQRVPLPIALAPLWMGAVLLVVVWADGWIPAHFLLGAVPWLLVAGVPALHAEPRLAAYALAGGLTLLVCGVGDHRLMVDTLMERRELSGGTHPRTL